MICGVPPRAFAHHPITTLPAPMSFEPWAESLLRVLDRATQTRPGDRYQRVKEILGRVSEASSWEWLSCYVSLGCWWQPGLMLDRGLANALRSSKRRRTAT